MLGIALGYSSPSAAGKWIETINVVSMGRQDGVWLGSLVALPWLVAAGGGGGVDDL